MKTARASIVFIGGALWLVFFFISIILTGPIKITPGEALSILFGHDPGRPVIDVILLQTRLPVAVAAACCGAMLSVAGLMMQTLFHNPLAGPSVMGISSGASFGVAVFMLGTGIAGFWIPASLVPVASTVAALAGAVVTIAVLFAFSSVLKSAPTLLIVGLMLSYLFSSGISLLNYFSKAEEIRSFMLWGLGGFSGMRLNSSLWLLLFTAVALSPVILFAKPLNAMLLGERYMESVGYSVRRLRGWMLLSTGILVAVPTAFCGPIGFVGLIVPHFCRLLLKSSNHLLLIPASILIGAVVMMGCAWAGILPAAETGVLPINVITPVIGVPVILYLLMRRNKILYF